MDKMEQGDYDIVKFGRLEIIIKREDVGYVIDIYDDNGMLHSTSTIWDDDITLEEENE